MTSGTDTRYDAIVIGGGFFCCGASVAAHLRRRCGSVLLVEREPTLLARASYANQARVHQGYHYPRSLLTALRSRVNFGRFVESYRDCVKSDFRKYYAVPRRFSNVTAGQFHQFCVRIGAPIKPAPAPVRRLFSDDLIEEVFEVEEYAFDAVRLRDRVCKDLERTDVEVRVSTIARRLRPGAGALAVELESAASGETAVVEAPRVFNCGYAGMNALLESSAMPPIPLKFETAEMALIEPPEELREAGVTVMCGPFFSVMPFPARGLHTLSHVRYTPHRSWQDREGRVYPERERKDHPPTRYEHMVRDAARYLPCLGRSRYADSLWETKTVLPVSETDDSRPILFRRGHGDSRLVCVMGGKIDNIFDVLQELDGLHERKEL